MTSFCGPAWYEYVVRNGERGEPVITLLVQAFILRWAALVTLESSPVAWMDLRIVALGRRWAVVAGTHRREAHAEQI
ncbi:hypothetical protein F6P96_18615 [Escherichia coli]|nr:hypothetical protein F6P96_18615 [Escherichia coli]